MKPTVSDMMADAPLGSVTACEVAATTLGLPGAALTARRMQLSRPLCGGRAPAPHPCGGVQGGEQGVLRPQVRPRQRLDQAALARIRVALSHATMAETIRKTHAYMHIATRLVDCMIRADCTSGTVSGALLLGKTDAPRRR